VEKDVEFEQAASGMIGLETALPLCLDLIAKNAMSPMALFARMSTAPAKILGLPGGTLAPGSVADVTVVDPQSTWVCDASRFRSKSRNSPFIGRTMRGRAMLTIVGGNIVFAQEKVLG
jgi:dihydroorotase